MADDFNTGDMLSVYLFENQRTSGKSAEYRNGTKDADGFDEDSINEIFRTMHTIKADLPVL